MNKLSASIKALIAFVVIIIVLGVGYFYWNNKQFTNGQADILPTDITAVRTAIVENISNQGLILGRNAQILKVVPFNSDSGGQSKVSGLAYSTDSTNDEVAKLYTDTLPTKGYTLYKKFTDATSTRIFATSAEATLSITIETLSTTTQKVAVVLGKK